MAIIAPAVVNLNTAQLKVGANNFETSVSAVSIVPAVPTSTFVGIAGNTIATTGAPTWVLNFTYVQDFATTNSLALTLLNGNGTSATIDLTLKTGGPVYRVVAILQPGQIGGNAGSDVLTADVSLSVTGQPVLVGA